MNRKLARFGAWLRSQRMNRATTDPTGAHVAVAC
jgi:hypothetical protein